VPGQQRVVPARDIREQAGRRAGVEIRRSRAGDQLKRHHRPAGRGVVVTDPLDRLDQLARRELETAEILRHRGPDHSGVQQRPRGVLAESAELLGLVRSRLKSPAEYVDSLDHRGKFRADM
jgi:hypothetical protein